MSAMPLLLLWRGQRVLLLHKIKNFLIGENCGGMSTELFLNTKYRLSKQQLIKVKEYFKRSGVWGIGFRYFGRMLNLEGENYYFDSMWTPFLKPLSEFKKSEAINYNELNSIFETVKKIVNFLLNENYSIKLFFASVGEKEFSNKEQTTLRFSDLDEFRSFEWGTVYEIHK